MSITFLPYIQTSPDGAWRCPEVCSQDPDRFTLNLSNDNALDVLERLGFPGQPFAEAPIPIMRFAETTTRALRLSLDQPSPALATQTIQSAGGITLILGARPKGYIQRRLHDLAVLVRRGSEIGATHISWT